MNKSAKIANMSTVNVLTAAFSSLFFVICGFCYFVVFVVFMRFRGLPVFRVFFGFLLFRRRYQTGRAGRRSNLLLMLNLTRSVGQRSGRGITQLANMSIDPSLSNSQPAYVEAFLEERQSWTCQPFPCYRSAVVVVVVVVVVVFP